MGVTNLKTRLLALVFSCLGGLLLPRGLSGQNAYLDSLLQELPQASNDSNKVILLNEIAWELKFDHPDSARSYLKLSLGLSIDIDFRRGMGDAYNFRGVVEDIHGRPDLAVDYFKKALEVREELEDIKGMASMYNNIGNLYKNKGDYKEAMSFYRQSMFYREQLGDTSRLMRLQFNMGNLEEARGNYDEALNYMLDFLEYNLRSGDSTAIASATNIVGNIKLELERYPEAERHFSQALGIHQRLGNRAQEASVLNNIGNLRDAVGSRVFYTQKDNELALALVDESIQFFESSRAISLELDDFDALSKVENNLGVVYTNRGIYYEQMGRINQATRSWKTAEEFLTEALRKNKENEDRKGECEVLKSWHGLSMARGDFQQALRYIDRYALIAREIEDAKFIQSAYQDYADAYFELGEYRAAFLNLDLYDSLRYVRLNEKRVMEVEQREAIYGDLAKKHTVERQEQELRVQQAELRQARVVFYAAIGGVGLVSLLALLLYNRNQIKTKANKQLAEKNRIIEKERKRSDDLLENILPKATAKELKERGKAKARHYEQVTVLFTDFKSFTQIAEKLSPEELVAELDTCFREFDEITRKHGVEKIKTIGDAYMCAGGLPEVNETHAEDVVRAALEMRDYMLRFAQEQRQAGKPVFEIRIGNHTGPVVSVIVGNRKFAYDIWGDAVNIAARMESSSIPGKINISQKTYNLVHEQFSCTPRGKVSAKNKGEMEMFFVEA